MSTPAPKNRIGGISSIWIDGAAVPLRGALKIGFGTPERTGVAGQDGTVHGYTEKRSPPSIDLEMSDDPNLDHLALRDLTDATVVAQTATGKTWTLVHAWTKKIGPLETEDGKISLELEGRELIAS